MRSRVLASWWIIALSGLLCAQPSTAAPSRAVAELYTSLGCDSCPPADAMVGRLSEIPALLVLSFHVNYWDTSQFRDPFASQAITERQNAYGRSLHLRTVGTPQLIVNGVQSLFGSELADAPKVLAAATQAAYLVKVTLSKQPDNGFMLNLDGAASGAEIWEIRYVKHSVTLIRGGENAGRTLETFNNVTHFRRLGWFASGSQSLQALKAPEDGLAVIVQVSGLGKVLGASTSD
jgi:hypothetical protein